MRVTVHGDENLDKENNCPPSIKVREDNNPVLADYVDPLTLQSSSASHRLSNSVKQNKETSSPEVGLSVLPIDELAICAKVHGMLIPDVHKTIGQKVDHLDHNLYCVADVAAGIQKKIEDMEAYVTNILAVREPSKRLDLNIVLIKRRMDHLECLQDIFATRTHLSLVSAPPTTYHDVPSQTIAISSALQNNAVDWLHTSLTQPSPYRQLEPRSGPIHTAHEPCEVLVHCVSFVNKDPQEASKMLLQHVKSLTYWDVRAVGKVFGYTTSVLSIRFKTSDAAQRFAAAFIPPIETEALHSFTVELADSTINNTYSMILLDDIIEAPITSD
ncbi:hypothetical protein ARMSODRAFT_1019791 [Armillaria solidipes]|uniref:Uncharacterized protein n=1 Tax=Armillaria solidipes TaxID=1076256 RepID=A0A2H3BYV1_9AGAR|nr:hypothetical protein ARMSODRAFT_1019791 [Armillaria solidipes]